MAAKIAKAMLRWALLAAVFGVAVEFSGYLGRWWLTGRPFSHDELQQLMQQQIESARFLSWTVGDRASPTTVIVPHPYVGFVFNPDFDPEGGPVEGSMPVSKWGFLDDKNPIRPQSDEEFVIGIFGGSVAFYFSVLGIEAMLTELNQVPELAAKRLVVIRTALSGFKQPQQLMTLNYLLALGGHFDMVINLDGANDVSLAPGWHVQQGIYAFFPRDWPLMLGESGDPNATRMVGEVTYLERLRGQVAGYFSRAWIRDSAAANVVWLLLDRRLDQSVQEARVRLAEYIPKASKLDRGFAAHGPPQDYSHTNVLFDDLARVWKQSSLQMHAICTALGIRYFHFLQPNQYVADSKPMADIERNLGILPGSPFDLGVRIGYPLLRAAGRDLSESGVSFHDLTNIFQEVREPLYIDTCCHLNKTGNSLLGKKIGEVLRREIARPQ